MLKELLYWYENLSPQSLNDLSQFYTEDSFFKDPFNEITGREKIKLIFEHMFENTEKPRFIFIDSIQEGNQVFLTWDFKFEINKKKYKIHGSSHLKLNTEGKVYYHRDYWDVGEEVLSKVPIIKSLYKMLTAKLRV